MLGKFQPKSIKKIFKSFKKKKEINTTQESAPPKDPLPDRIAAALCPALAKRLLLKEEIVSERELALKCEILHFQSEKNEWEAAVIKQEATQALVKEGATIMFRANRLQAQVEKEEQRRSLTEFENGLFQATQLEIDAIALERDQVVATFLSAATAHSAATTVALQAKARADFISDTLTKTLDNIHRERVHLGAVTNGVNARSAELDTLIAAAKEERVETYERSQSLVRRFNVATAAMSLAQTQLQTAATKEHQHVFKLAEKEKEDTIERARKDIEKRMRALREAQAAFEKHYTMERGHLAKRLAGAGELLASLQNEKDFLKQELRRARLLTIKAEQARAGAVDAKKAALGEWHEAQIMKEETRCALDQCLSTGKNTTIIESPSQSMTTDTTTRAKDEDGREVKIDSKNGRISRLGFNGDGNQYSWSERKKTIKTTNHHSAARGGADGKKFSRGPTSDKPASYPSLPLAAASKALRTHKPADKDIERITRSPAHARGLFDKENMAGATSGFKPVASANNQIPTTALTTQKLRASEASASPKEIVMLRDMQTERTQLVNIANT